MRVLEPGDPAPEFLYWVGCAASFDERAKKTAESTAKLLQKAGVDFAILGPRESCTGDPARRMGNEYVFQAFAEQNVATLNEAGRDEDRRELPALLQHARERVPRLRRQLRGACTTRSCSPSSSTTAGCSRRRARSRSRTTTAATSRATTTSAMEPRKLLNVIGQPVEMKRSGKQTFCCGAGGAHMWMEERGTPINEERAREATETGAETLAVACPFCTVMLDDGVRAAARQLRVADVATLLAESLTTSDRRPRSRRPRMPRPRPSPRVQRLLFGRSGSSRRSSTASAASRSTTCASRPPARARSDCGRR